MNKSDFERKCAPTITSSETSVSSGGGKKTTTFAKCVANNAEKIEEYRINVPLNVAFIGFENDGRYDVSIRPEEMASGWTV